MATTKQAPRGGQVQRVAMYPLDWLEERSGLIGGVKYFLFRKVPGDTGWWHTLGSATLTAFLVQLITGVILAMYYKPDPATAYQSIQHITNDLTLGWLVRGMHKWGASVFIILMFFHMARVFIYGAYKYPRELNWIIGVLLLVMGMLEGFTGYLLPWDQTAYWATVVGINLNGTAPILGPFLADFLRGGAEIGGDTLSRFYSMHMLLIPIGLFEGFTGYLLPWDQTAYWATVVGININATGPFVGPFLAQFLQGGLMIGPDTLPKFYALHMLVLPGAIMALIGLHLYLVVRLGVVANPWTQDGAGAERDGAPIRRGLTQPRSRGVVK